MKKATHSGHCQLCGRGQMLPNGKLSKHGYTVEWNFFNGVCDGADNQPYEESCALLPPVIVSMKAQAARLRAAAKETRAQTASVWVNERIESTRGYGYAATRLWREIPVGEMIELGYDAKWMGKDGKPQSTRTYVHTKVQADVVAYLNEQRATDFERSANQHKTYVEWCEKRVAEWKPAPLVALDRSQDRKVVMHIEWSRGAYCASRNHNGTYRETTRNPLEVNCKACLKAVNNASTLAHILKGYAAKDAK